MVRLVILSLLLYLTSFLVSILSQVQKNKSQMTYLINFALESPAEHILFYIEWIL